MPTKLHINLQQGIIDVEGETDLVKEVYADFKDHLLKKAASAPTATTPSNTENAPTNSGNKLDLSTNSIAAHIGVSSGPDLVMAAVAHLMLSQRKDKCTRKDISDEMKSATTYYKKSMSGNLTASLDTLVKAKRLNQISKDVYALSASEKTSLESQLAQ
jgi:hypothetical protein